MTHKPYGPYERFIKRPQDFLCALAATIVLSPVMIVTAFLVRTKLGSPVLFTQDRPGKDGKIFKLYKFRTMTDEKDENGEPLPDEDRLTSFGRKLRSTSLDELPELFNILKGDMAIIGPRPLLVEYVPWYSEEQAHRHDVRPGLTGYAQAHGRNTVDWDQRFQMDIHYVNNITFFNDVTIIADTVKEVNGDYITFVDSDDTVEPNMLEIMLEYAVKYNADIVECMLKGVYADGKEDINNYSSIRVLNSEEAAIADLGLDGGSVSACGKLYKNRIFESRFFREGRIAEDLYAIMDSLNRAKIVIIIPDALYNYYHHEGTITTSKFSARDLDSIYASKYCIKVVETKYPKALKAALFRYDWSCIFVFDRILMDDNWRKNEYLKPIKKMISRNMIRILTHKKLTIKRKSALLVSMFSLRLYRKVIIARRNKTIAKN